MIPLLRAAAERWAATVSTPRVETPSDPWPFLSVYGLSNEHTVPSKTKGVRDCATPPEAAQLTLNRCHARQRQNYKIGSSHNFTGGTWMAPWIDPLRQKILIAPYLPENILLLRSLEARRIAMHGRPPAPAGGKRHVARHLSESRTEIEGAKTKQGATTKAAWARPEVRARVMAGLRAYHARRRAAEALLRGLAEALTGLSLTRWSR